MDIDRLSSDGLGDLPEDVLGSQKTYLKIGGESIGYEASELDRILGQSWAGRRDGQTTLIPNNEYLQGVPESKNAGLEAEDIIKKARLMNMGNQPAMKVKQFLSEFVRQGKVSAEEALNVLRERPLHGQLFFCRNVGTCKDLRKAAKNPQAKYALWVIMSEECKACKQVQDFCPETGLRLVEMPLETSDPETSEELLKEACAKLRSRGRLMSGVKINSWDDLRQALQPQDKEITQRIYPHAAHIPSIIAPAITEREKARGLAEAALQNKKNDNEINQVIYSREVIPIARYISELMLKKADPSVIRAEVERTCLDKKLVEAAVAFIKAEADPLLLTTSLAAHPIFYGSCESCRDFLRKQNVRPAYVSSMPRCSACHWRDNPQRLCSLIGAKVLDGRELDTDDVDKAINELRTDGQLTTSQVRGLEVITNPRERLEMAVRLSMDDRGRKEALKCDTRENSLVLSAASFAGRENAVLWCRESLSNGATVSQVREAVARTRNDSDRIVEEALLGMDSINAASIDKCLTEDHVFKTGAVLCKDVKCNSCKNSDSIGCKKYGLIFTGASAVYGDEIAESQEAREVRSFFADSAMDVQVKPAAEKAGLDIKISNPGQDLVVDIHKDDGVIDNYEKLFEIAESVIEPDQPRTGAAPLDVSELGNSAFDISALL